MHTWIPGTLILLAALAAFLFWEQAWQAARRFNAPACPTCGLKALRADWRSDPISCCHHHHLEANLLSQFVMRYQLPTQAPLLPPDHPHRQPRLGTWPSCPTCGHYLLRLSPAFRASLQPDGTPAEAPRAASGGR